MTPGVRGADGVLVGAVVVILVVLVSPIPAAILDFLLLANLSLALLVLVLSFSIERPLAFSTFPSVLLLATLLRLALNVAATRLILTHADAGRVIASIGAHVVAGNYVIGLVVFLILIVVQFVVVTSGAQRVAEVAARFTLDAMPGKQMSIDADLNMGLIAEADARQRRREIEREASFYGAMDGASKFVKGDAVAGILIVLVNIVGGLAVGIAQKDMSWSQALHTFTLLTVGDGIVTQIPALVVATATGIIVTRAATDARLGPELGAQVARHPRALLAVVAALGAALVMPGIPALPVLLLLAVTGAWAWRSRRGPSAAAEPSATAEAVADTALPPAVEALELEIGAGLSGLLGGPEGAFLRRFHALRSQFSQDQGLVLPPLRVVESAARTPESYALRVQGALACESFLRPGRLLAIDGGRGAVLEGERTRDPAFRLDAAWIEPATADAARGAGHTVVDPVTVLLTHLSETLHAHGHELVTRAETDRLLRRIRDTQPSLVEELIPALLSLGDVQRVLQALLREHVPVRHLEAIVEVLADAARSIKDPELLAERVRERLGPHICERLRAADGALHVLTLDSAAGQLIQGVNAGEQADVAGALERTLRDLHRRVDEMAARNVPPVLLAPQGARRAVRRLTEQALPRLAVLSPAEIPGTAMVKAFGVVSA